MNAKVVAGSAIAVALMGLGILTGSVVGTGGASAQTAVATAQPTAVQTAPDAPAVPRAPGDSGNTVTAAITQQQAEQAALAASPGNTVDHTNLSDQNGTPVYDVDFTNGGGVTVNGQTGAVISTEAAGADKGGRGGFGGQDQAALAAKAKITQQEAEKTALTANPGSTVDHSRLGDNNGTVFWDVDFTNGGGATINAETGAIIASEAAGTDQGGHRGGPPANRP